MIDSSPLFQRTAGGLLWISLSTCIKALVQFVVLIILARLLTPEDFGLVAAALIVVGLAQIFSVIGIGPALVQKQELEMRHVKTGLFLALCLGGLFFLITWLSAPAIAGFFEMEALVDVLRLVAFLFVIKAFGVVSESLLEKELAFKLLSILSLTSFTIGFGMIAIILAILEFGPFALAWAYIAQACLMTAFLFFLRRPPLDPLPDKQSIIELLNFGSGYTISRIGNYLATQVDSIIVGRVMDAASLGIYGRALQIVKLPLLLGQVLDKVLFPAMARIQTDNKRLSRAYCRGISATTVVMLPVTVFFILFADSIVLVTLGHQWTAAVLPLQILSFSLVFRINYKMSNTLARAMGAVYRQAWRQWVYALAVVVFAFFGSYWGISGVAAGVTIAIVVNWLMMAGLSIRVSGLSWMDFVKAHKAGICLGGIYILFIVGFKLLSHQFIGEIPSMFLALLITPFVIISLWHISSSIFLGDGGKWLLNQVGLALPRAERFFRRITT